MKALILGVVVLAAAAAVCLPGGLGWWDEVLVFLKGCVPVLAVFIGLIAIFIGVADIKDRSASKKEEQSSEKSEV
jgi:hypothetical protein